MLLYNPEQMPPILPKETPVAWTYPDVIAAAASGIPEFVRRARLKLETNHNPRHLNDALRLADLAIEHTAEGLGVKTIDYDWYLFPAPCENTDDLFDVDNHPLIPDGFSLVARVENIYPAITPSATTEAELALRISRVSRGDALVLEDLNVEHVAYDPHGMGYLVDIDAEVSGIVAPHHLGQIS